MDHQIQYPGNMAEGTLMPQNDAVKLTPELIDSFEAYMKNKGMDQGSIKSYRQAVEMLYQWLPEEKVMDRDTLRQWSENLQKESYAVRTVNRFLSVGNTLADFLGHREFQIKTLMVDADEVLPELTRNEYLRMLQTAKALKNERVYFLIKVFANVDLPVQQASKLTVEAAEEGKLVINRGGGREIIRLPKCLCQELLSYAKRSGITTGPLFLTRQKNRCGGHRSPTVSEECVWRLKYQKEKEIPGVCGSCIKRPCGLFMPIWISYLRKPTSRF